MPYRFTSEALKALDIYITDWNHGNDVRDLDINKINTVISILLYDNDDDLGFYITKTGKVSVKKNIKTKDSDWKNPVEMTTLLKNYVEEY